MKTINIGTLDTKY